MIDSVEAAEYSGDPAHPDHEAWLTALGRATYASQALAGVAVDVLRTHGGVDFWALMPETLGGLAARIERLDKVSGDVPGLSAWLAELAGAVVTRNDLLHALPVRHGLQRRTAKNPGRVVDFFTVVSLDAATTVLTDARRSGNMLLYYDGGDAVARLTTPARAENRDA